MYFKEAATVDGGCSGGMLFWGLSLRSGWGVARDEKKGFEWLRRACEPAPPSREGSGSGGPTEAAVLAPEMVVAILEVAQCFLHGWGCSKDPEKAVNYLLVAAKMGDVDAQLREWPS
jgi:TPR repeat protein